ncbi:hypothetical protein EDD36DRAFT_23072 [Exophiala viscosa]|uniref:F-box domain-containing protein n=1 Tax=Exophiala viscosa TaxID=2486360 RepID=A0AAN6IK31_9EURO|nr:hypothetical protein EDD36DRAFT_23072 [Exophiala viscosa]
MALVESSGVTSLPTSLLDLLSNSLILENTVPYLPLSAIFALSRTSHSFRELLLRTTSVFRYVDLSKCRGAYVSPNLLTRIDVGGNSWRAERIDENLTEDEFLSGPLRGVLSNLRRMKVLANIQTLVLDGLSSVTNDLINDIVTSPEYNIRLLSIRKCLNVNEAKLQQLLRHLCRPSRPEGTPRLQGLYFFSLPALTPRQKENELRYSSSGVTTSQGAQLGAAQFDDLFVVDGVDRWYAPSGRIMVQGYVQRSPWEETLLACAGIISFDAILCDHMHEDMAPVLHPASRDYLAEIKAGIPPLATFALGPGGCAGCGRAPHGAPVWGVSDPREFPLLWPPPCNGRLVDAVRPPTKVMDDGSILPQRLIVSCTWCLTNRHCDNCHRWWCSDCYNPTTSKKLSDLERLDRAGLSYLPSREELSGGASEENGGDHIKHRNLTISPGQPAVTRDCFECGRVCSLCAPLSTRTCKRCKSTYCIQHNTGCDEFTCDWCMFRGGRRTRELY